ncbi:MAG: hypothetical protein JXA09_02820 [Anaerolineae bacterium]|nr:hypothetical protein [Anaerolineae bacterium]
MLLEVLSTGVIVLGLALTVYCVVRLSLRYRIVARDLAAYRNGRKLPAENEQDCEAPSG